MSTCMLNPQLTEVVLRLTPSTRFTESAPERGHSMPWGNRKKQQKWPGKQQKVWIEPTNCCVYWGYEDTNRNVLGFGLKIGNGPLMYGNFHAGLMMINHPDGKSHRPFEPSPNRTATTRALRLQNLGIRNLRRVQHPKSSPVCSKRLLFSWLEIDRSSTSALLHHQFFGCL
jgi:hypothetical protein